MTRFKCAVAVMITVTLVLTACSRLEFVYDHSGWLATRRIDSYLDLSDSQRQYVRDTLEGYKEFHRAVRVPQLLELIGEIRTLVDRPQPTASEMEAVVDAAEQHYRATVSDLVTFAADLLSRISASQIDHLGEKLDERREEHAEKDRSDRFEETIDRVEEWSGSLSDEQEDFIRACHSRLPETTEQWLSWRRQEDNRLLSLLRNDADPPRIEAFLRDWWLDKSARPEALRQARATKRRIWLDCAETFMAEHATDAQRTHALKRLRNHRDSLERIAAE